MRGYRLGSNAWARRRTLDHDVDLRAPWGIGWFSAWAAVGAVAFLVGAPAVEAARDRWGIGRPSAAQVEEADWVMRQRAPAEAMAGTSDLLLQQIKAGLDEELGASEWQDAPVVQGTQGCDAASLRVAGVLSETATTSSPRVLDTDESARAQAVLAETGVLHGITGRPEEVVSSAGTSVRIATDRHGWLSVSTARGLVVSVTSDCYRSRESPDDWPVDGAR